MPKRVRNLQISFSENSLTHFGGIFLIGWFCKKLRLKRVLQNQLRRFPQRNNRYSWAELILSLLHTIISGIGRLSTTRILQYNGPFQQIIGLKTFPYASTLRRFLIRIPSGMTKRIIEVHDQFRLKIFYCPHPRTSLILDLDSTVLTVYGKLQGATVGYNPHKPGRPSYRPLLCFEGHTQDCWHGVFRSGNTPSAIETGKFLEECFAKIPAGIYRIRVRADEGFYNWKVVEFLDAEQAGYAIVAKVTKPIQHILSGIAYHDFKKSWEAGEFFYQPHGWKQLHRFIVVRRPLPEEPDAQLTLFVLNRHAYHVIVSNLSLLPESVWHFYKRRAGVELNIKELKWDYPLAKIPTRNFRANEAYFHLSLFAYNIVNWFKRLCLPKKFHHATIRTIRTQLLMLPAKLVKSGNRNVLKLPTGYVHQKLFQEAIRKIQKLKSF